MSQVRPLPAPEQHSVLDDARLNKRFVKEAGRGDKEIVLSVDKISCSGCISRIETQVRQINGVRSIQINPSTHRAIVVWDDAVLSARELLQSFASAGYPATPYEVRKQESRSETERKQALIRITVAAALGMQVMMIAVALYFGDAFGMDEAHRTMFRYVAMALTVPVLLCSARPFFSAAWRNLSHGTVGVDVPVSLALLVAFGGSVLTTIGYSGQVYYESVVMFTFLLLSARYLELSARRKSLTTILQMEKAIPEMAARLNRQGKATYVDVDDLQVGDRVLVRSGELIPADGIVIDGVTTVDESILTGESVPVDKNPGTGVVAGSVNIENGLTIEVNQVADNNVLSRIIRMTELAQNTRPRAARVADRIAAWFVTGVLILTLTAGLYWWFHDQSMWLPVVISTLVIACPCALSLATPAAYVAAMGALTKRGILPVKSEFLEDLADIDHIVFDKTGTLTRGELSLDDVIITEGWDKKRAINIAALLNRDSRHPLAAELQRHAGNSDLVAGKRQHTPGGGVIGEVEGKRYAVGSANFIDEFISRCGDVQHWIEVKPGHSLCLLADEQRVIARFEFRDEVRADSADIVAQLAGRGFSISLLSGDHDGAVASTARLVGIDDYRARLSPSDKLQIVEELQSAGKRVAVVGDGINDAPVLAAANVSFAMGHSTDLTKINADVVLLNNRLSDLLDVMELSRRTNQVINQNFMWAIAYNLLALPAAVSGLIPPWLAAIGMSVSSLIVSTNALRLLRTRNQPEKDRDLPVVTRVKYA